MKGLRPVIFTISLALVLSACASTKSENVSQNSQAKVTKSTPSCTKEEFSGGSKWINGQLRAFGEDNLSKAYTYASETFQKNFNLKMFTLIIIGEYSMLLNLKSFQVDSCGKSGERFVFNGKLEDKEGTQYAMEYTLSRIQNKWGVDGAQVSKIAARIDY